MLRVTLILVAVLVVAIGAGAAIIFWPKDGHKATASLPANVNSASGSGGADSAADRASGFSTFDPEREMEEGELVVLDPPETFPDEARQLGFTILETVRLDRLSMTLYRVRIPRDSSVEEARRTLGARFPGATIDVNRRFDPSQSRRRHSAEEEGAAAAIKMRDAAHITSFAQAAMGWKNVPETCGKGVRLGLVTVPL